MSKIALALQHDSTIHLGNLEPVLRQRGYDIQVLDARTADFAGVPVMEWHGVVGPGGSVPSRDNGGDARGVAGHRARVGCSPRD